VGVDPTAGVFHTDKPFRDSFVCDVMEVVRPDVDAWLLEFVQNHKFSAKDFYEKRDGGIRITLKLTPILAETVSLWSKKIESTIGQVEGILLKNRTPDNNKYSKRKSRI
jgi:CRISPR/Cas system-associated endonuclease Cas1